MAYPDHYVVLGVGREATTDQVRRAYRRAARATHPDAGGSAADFQAVQEAWAVLSDGELRASYDRELDGISDWEALGWGPDEPSAEPASPAPARPPDTTSAPPPAPRHDPTQRPVPPADPAPAAGPASVRPSRSEPRSPGPGPAVPWSGWPDPSPDDRRDFASVTGPLDPFRSEPVPLPDPLAAPFPSVAKTSRSAWKTAGIVAALVVAVPVAVVGAGHGGLALIGCASIMATRASNRRKAAAQAATLLQSPEVRIERHRRAEAWNAVLRAQRTSGAMVRQVGSVALDTTGMVVPGHRWTRDPVTQAQEVRRIVRPLPDGAWVAIDPDGRVVATAPLGGPEAWVEILVSLAS